MLLAIPEAHLVDKGRGKDVGVADCDAVYIPFLCAVAVAAAVGDSPEGRGHMLRVVNVAVAPEHLVMLIEMLVDAYIECSLTEGIDRSGLIVVFHAGQVLRRKELEKLNGIGVQTAGGELIVGKSLSDIAAAGGHDSSDRIHLARSHRARRRRIKNLSVAERAPQCVCAGKAFRMRSKDPRSW